LRIECRPCQGFDDPRFPSPEGLVPPSSRGLGVAVADERLGGRLEGKLEIRRAELLAEAKEQLRREYADQVPADRAKLDRLIENRARRVANGEGEGS
jgi:hypothetical protein